MHCQSWLAHAPFPFCAAFSGLCSTLRFWALCLLPAPLGRLPRSLLQKESTVPIKAQDIEKLQEKSSAPLQQINHYLAGRFAALLLSLQWPRRCVVTERGDASPTSGRGSQMQHCPEAVLSLVCVCLPPGQRRTPQKGILLRLFPIEGLGDSSSAVHILASAIGCLFAFSSSQ